MSGKKEKKIILCDLCSMLGGNGQIISTNDNPWDEVKFHTLVHRVQLKFIGDSADKLKVEKVVPANESKMNDNASKGRRRAASKTIDGEQKKRRDSKETPNIETDKSKKQGRGIRPPLPVPPTPPQYSKDVESYCLDLLKQRREGRSVQCAVCNGFLTVCRCDAIEARFAVLHAYHHLGSVVYCCKHCDKRTNSDASIKTHLDTIHKLGRVQANFTIVSTKGERDVIEMITKCYAKSSEQS